MDWQQLSALRSERFPELPLDCGNISDPGVGDIEGFCDWSELGTTADQLRIEDYLDGLGMRGKSILHIGIGNSGLAKRFRRHASRIFGISITPSEVRKAAALNFPNYQAILHNKFLGATDLVRGSFDFIVDNNLTGFCCCLTHFGRMLDFYASKLASNGQVVTDRQGLSWTNENSLANGRWGFSFDDLAAAAHLAGLTAYEIDEDIYVLARNRPSRLTLASQAGYFFRMGKRKLSTAARYAMDLLSK